VIKEFAHKFVANQAKVEAKFAEFHPGYEGIVKAAVEAISEGEDYGYPDPERITVIDHGDYQGTLLFIIGAQGYQPSQYWSVSMGYGSCSYCDTVQGIREEGEYGEKPNADQVKEYTTLALHVAQRIKEI